jgi:hypothetical protein
MNRESTARSPAAPLIHINPSLDGQTMNDLDFHIGQLVIANRILASEGVVDAYGHVSMRHPRNPEHYLLACSRSPELVERADIMEFTLDGNPVNDDGRAPYLERFIHGGIYEARPDIHAVVHAHAEDVLPFSITTTPLRPVIHSGSFMGAHVPVWDIADTFGEQTNLLVTNMPQGRRTIPHRGRQNVRLRATQRPSPHGCDATGGRGQEPVSGRDRGESGGLQTLFGGNVAGVGILGEQGKMRPFGGGTSGRRCQDIKQGLKLRRFGAPLIAAVAGRRVNRSTTKEF